MYMDPNKQYIKETLKRWPFFMALDKDDQNAFIYNFELTAFKKNSLI
jgi:hypothetical protein